MLPICKDCTTTQSEINFLHSDFKKKGNVCKGIKRDQLILIIKETSSTNETEKVILHTQTQPTAND